MKVTPGHDPEDYERGKRHALPIVIVLDGKGRITKEGGAYAGLSREQARDKVVKDLDAQGLLEKVEDHALRVAISDRSKSVIEPLVSEQWFVKMEPLAKPAIAAAKSGTLKFRPARWEKVYLDWLEHVRDWCISRQLWWGHRVPVWYDADGATVALLEDPEPGAKHPKTGKPLVRQDEDVLDTWASSWLWPMSTLGWPDKSTEDYRAFYPTQFLSTAREIIYLWVARMVMAGYEFDGRCPFDTVYIHATILDQKGRRMSKSAGNGIDPVDMIDKYGADAVRFALVDLTTEGQDVRLAENRFEVGRNFMNKLWNAGRMVELYGRGSNASVDAWPDNLQVEDRWIRNKYWEAARTIHPSLMLYGFHEYARRTYEFTWNDFCDWYLEIVKPRLTSASPNDAARSVMRIVFSGILRLLHPVCPYITEELYQRLGYLRPGESSIARARWPFEDSLTLQVDYQASAEIEKLQRVVTAVRMLRAEYRVSEAVSVDAVVKAPAAIAESLLRQESGIRRLGKIERFTAAPDAARPRLSAVAHLPGGVEVFVPLEGHIDLAAEKARLAKEIEKQQGLLDSVDRKLGNADFTARAKPEVVEAERARRADAAALLERLRASLSGLG